MEEGFLSRSRHVGFAGFYFDKERLIPSYKSFGHLNVEAWGQLSPVQVRAWWGGDIGSHLGGLSAKVRETSSQLNSAAPCRPSDLLPDLLLQVPFN